MDEHEVQASISSKDLFQCPQRPSLERPLKLVDQLLLKTEEGKLSWTTGIEDGQFITVFPNGEGAFVVQVKDDLRKFLVLNDHQEPVLEEAIPESVMASAQVELPKCQLYDRIGRLQSLARLQALQVDDKLVKAEQFLASI